MKTKEDSKKLKGKNKKKNNSEVEEIKALEAQYDSVSIVFFLMGSFCYVLFTVFQLCVIRETVDEFFIHSLHRLEYCVLGRIRYHHLPITNTFLHLPMYFKLIIRHR